MHPQDKEKIEQQVLASIKNTTLKDGYPNYQSYSAHLKPIYQRVLKTKSKWISDDGISSVYFSYVYGLTQNKLKDQADTDDKKLSEMISEAELSELSKEITERYYGIPYQYEVSLPLESLRLDLDFPIKLSDSLSLTLKEDSPLSLLRNPLAGNADTGKKVHLTVNAEGFLEYSIESNLIRNALTKFKTVIQRAYSKCGIEKNKNAPKSGLMGLMRNYDTNKTSMIIHEVNSSNEYPATIELPYSYSDFINYLTLTDLYQKNANYQKGLIALMQSAAKLSENNSQDAKRIVAAIEWHFDSVIEHDTTMKFIKVCIGLESILGDNEDNGRITKTLADRCAYLNGTSISERNEIRDTFEKLYNERSKLIHGVHNQLEKKQEKLLSWGHVSLQKAINNESELLK